MFSIYSLACNFETIVFFSSLQLVTHKTSRFQSLLKKLKLRTIVCNCTIKIKIQYVKMQSFLMPKPKF